MFCVNCGTEGMLFESLCATCYSRRGNLAKIVPSISITLCTRCNSFLEKKRWDHYNDLDELIESRLMSVLEVDSNLTIGNIELSHRINDEHNRDMNIQLSGCVGDESVEVNLPFRVHLKRGVCEKCSRIAGKYYESILQVRGEGFPLDKSTLETVIRMVEGEIDRTSKKDRGSFISDEIEIHSGLDFYLGRIADGRNIAKTLSMRFGSRITESSSLIGRKEGKDVYRVTYLVRIPRYRAGNFVIYGEKACRVERVNTKKVVLLNLIDAKKMSVDRRDLKGIEILGNEEIIEKAVVTSQVSGLREIMLLHPRTFRSLEIIVPDSLEVPQTGTEVDVIVRDEDVYFV
ncbi:MAG: 60S ribosomal export protein NMD3 [Candidatus Thermoplasmatota archaeon]|jgi:nonsense-mediated mRNA decay protein 3|nr:60S ribosomal export protein NMD3 [Candidatus Thermoplasmatota archaeon]